MISRPRNLGQRLLTTQTGSPQLVALLPDTPASVTGLEALGPRNDFFVAMHTAYLVHKSCCYKKDFSVLKLTRDVVSIICNKLRLILYDNRLCLLSQLNADVYELVTYTVQGG